MTPIEAAKAAAPLADRGPPLVDPVIHAFKGIYTFGPDCDVSMASILAWLEARGFSVLPPCRDAVDRVRYLEGLLAMAQGAAREWRANEANRMGVKG